MRRTFLFLLVVAYLTASPGPVEIRQLIESRYPRMFDGLRTAKSMDDLDAQHKEFETADWVSIMPGEKPRTWQQLREYGFEALTSGPKDSMKFEVDKFTMPDEKTAVLEGTMRISGKMGEKQVEVSAPIRETWIQSNAGWRRKIHEKLAPNKVEVK